MPPKRCKRCGNPGQFRTRTKNGYHYTLRTCWECEKADRRAYYDANTALELGRKRAYHQARTEEQKERDRALDRARYWKHLEKRRALQKQWRAKNAERKRENWNRWKQENPERVKAIAIRSFHCRRARLANLPSEPIDRDAIAQRDGYRCYMCRRICRGSNLTLDHIIPVSKGGGTTTDNLRVACRSCNSRRGAGRIAAQMLLFG